MLCVSLLDLFLIIAGAAALGFFVAAICVVSNTADLQQQNNFFQEMLLIKEREISGYENQFGVLHFDDEGNVITDDIPIRSN